MGFGRGPHLSVTKFIVGGSRQGTDLRGTQNATAISLRRRLKKITFFASDVVGILIVFRNSVVGFSKV